MTALVVLTSQFRSIRRIRLGFSSALASGAFSTTPYAVSSFDGLGASPIGVEAAFAISTDPNSVEISVNSDFTPGGQYLVTCTNVPPALFRISTRNLRWLHRTSSPRRTTYSSSCTA